MVMITFDFTKGYSESYRLWYFLKAIMQNQRQFSDGFQHPA